MLLRIQPFTQDLFGQKRRNIDDLPPQRELRLRDLLLDVGLRAVEQPLRVETRAFLDIFRQILSDLRSFLDFLPGFLFNLVQTAAVFMLKRFEVLLSLLDPGKLVFDLLPSRVDDAENRAE